MTFCSFFFKTSVILFFLIRAKVPVSLSNYFLSICDVFEDLSNKSFCLMLCGEFVCYYLLLFCGVENERRIGRLPETLPLVSEPKKESPFSVMHILFICYELFDNNILYLYYWIIYQIVHYRKNKKLISFSKIFDEITKNKRWEHYNMLFLWIYIISFILILIISLTYL